MNKILTLAVAGILFAGIGTTGIVNAQATFGRGQTGTFQRGPQGFGFGGNAASLPIYQYKIEVSMDGEAFTTVLDTSNATVPRNVVFDEIPPVECRFVRLTMLDWPKNSPLSILDFSVFGKATGYSPSMIPVPALKKMN